MKNIGDNWILDFGFILIILSCILGWIYLKDSERKIIVETLEGIEQRLDALEQMNNLNKIEGKKMNGITITRRDIAGRISEELKISRDQSNRLTQDIIKAVKIGIIRDKQLKITDFGTFNVRHKEERMGRNPKTGEDFPIKPREVALFHGSDDLYLKMNQAA